MKHSVHTSIIMLTINTIGLDKNHTDLSPNYVRNSVFALTTKAS